MLTIFIFLFIFDSIDMWHWLSICLHGSFFMEQTAAPFYTNDLDGHVLNYYLHLIIPVSVIEDMNTKVLTKHGKEN